MSWLNAGATSAGVTERDFELSVNGHAVPGVCWEPEGGAEDLVLLGHGGTTHKRVDYIVEVARQLCDQGIAAMAIDGPGHGDRATSDLTAHPKAFAEAWRSAGGTETVIADWRAALDFVETEVGPRAAGWWGLSMGTMMGLPVCATDERIRVALLGLMGTWGPNVEDLITLAPELKCPVRFLVQWDDEIVPREACIELFTMLGSAKKTLHGNPGRHQDVPAFEIAASVAYLADGLKRTRN